MKKNIVDFFKFLSFIQAIINNSINVFTEVCSNEIFYDFKVLKATDLLNNNVTRIWAVDDNSAIVIKKEQIMLKKKSKSSLIMHKSWWNWNMIHVTNSWNSKKNKRCSSNFTKNTRNQDWKTKNTTNNESISSQSWKK